MRLVAELLGVPQAKRVLAAPISCWLTDEEVQLGTIHAACGERRQ